MDPEDPDFGKDVCGKLNVHMYGTRPAADGWHCEYRTTMSEGGFSIGQSSACVFRHKTRCLMSSVHGDDFTTVGSKKDLDWFKKELGMGMGEVVTVLRHARELLSIMPDGVGAKRARREFEELSRQRS